MVVEEYWIIICDGENLSQALDYKYLTYSEAKKNSVELETEEKRKTDIYWVRETRDKSTNKLISFYTTIDNFGIREE